MKRLFVFIVIFSLIILTPAMAKEINVNLDHDANIEADMANYLYFYRIVGQAYDYNNPFGITDCIVADGVCLPTGITLLIDAPDGQITTYQFVARAQDIGGLQSIDSNEVELSVNLTELPVVTS